MTIKEGRPFAVEPADLFWNLELLKVADRRERLRVGQQVGFAVDRLGGADEQVLDRGMQFLVGDEIGGGRNICAACSGMLRSRSSTPEGNVTRVNSGSRRWYDSARSMFIGCRPSVLGRSANSGESGASTRKTASRSPRRRLSIIPRTSCSTRVACAGPMPFSESIFMAKARVPLPGNPMPIRLPASCVSRTSGSSPRWMIQSGS